MAFSPSTADAACVIPVRASDALLWLQGRLQDRDLLLRSPLRPEAVFILNLPDRRSYAQALRSAAYWKERGAVCLICRTGTPVVERHLIKNECIKGVIENTVPVKSRFFCAPASFARWVGKFHRTGFAI